MTNMAKMGYYIISYIPKISKILYPKIYPYQGYYIRYRYEKIYIFPTTGCNLPACKFSAKSDE